MTGQAPTEQAAWSAIAGTATKALTFWEDFIGLRQGDGDGIPLDAAARGRLHAIVRAVSWVESLHGTGSGHHPREDPLQCGNPGDAWWRELTGQSGNGGRFVRSPDREPDLWSREIASASGAAAGFPAAAALGLLADPADGHRDQGFRPIHSFVWGSVYLLWCSNAIVGHDPTYQCRALSRDRLVRGAVRYNGGGDPRYRTKIEAALALLGEPLGAPGTQGP